VDRLRAPADQTSTVPEDTGSFPYAYESAATVSRPQGPAGRRGNIHAPPEGRSTLALHCVWRQ
jgi:hypothetical protein